LAQEGGDGASAEDDDGVQPLVALYRVASLRIAVADAIRADAWSVHALQARLQLPRVRFSGLRFGNLNTPDDLRLAGYADG
jgi:molybdopterin-guanine dinucleotide biosynthesis protein A